MLLSLHHYFIVPIVLYTLNSRWLCTLEIVLFVMGNFLVNRTLFLLDESILPDFHYSLTTGCFTAKCYLRWAGMGLQGGHIKLFLLCIECGVW